ncbi:MAG: hypothetical protein D6800_11045, partial [Candidatus Zixiibacteriota bacterium]
LNGYYRLQFVSDNIGNAGAKDARTASQIDQRLRMKLTNTLNDYVSFVYYGEVDTPWGQPSKGSIGGGGQASADGVNLETKNVYLAVKVPNTALSVKAGIQGFGTKNYTIFGDDFAALRLDYKLSDMASVVALYGKFYENNKVAYDDDNVYVLLGKFKLSETADVNVGLAWDEVNGAAGTTDTDTDVYVLFADGDFDLGMAKLEAQAAYSFGTMENGVGNPDTDLSGYMASAKATVNAGGADLGLRLTYYSADDNLTDNDWNAFAGNVRTGSYEFPGENLHIFFYDKYYNNTNGGGLAFGPAYAGNGLFAINGTANVKLGGGYDVKAGAGYFMALEENGAQDSDLGFEVAADFGRKLAEKVDVRLIGAYAVLGDFFNTTANNNDPDDVYLTKAVINVSF